MPSIGADVGQLLNREEGGYMEAVDAASSMPAPLQEEAPVASLEECNGGPVASGAAMAGPAPEVAQEEEQTRRRSRGRSGRKGAGAVCDPPSSSIEPREAAARSTCQELEDRQACFSVIHL